MLCERRVFLYIILAVLFSAAPLRAGEWERELFLGLNLSRGNSELTAGNITIEANREESLELQLASLYGRSDGEKNADRSYGAARYRWNFNRGFYAGAGLRAERDSVAAVDHRYILSGSLGKNIIRTERTGLRLEAGPGYLRESVADVKDSSVVVRAFEVFEHKLTGSSRIRQSLEYTASSREEYLLGFELGVTSALTSSLSLRVALGAAYDSSPAEGREKYDIGLTSSLGLSF